MTHTIFIIKNWPSKHLKGRFLKNFITGEIYAITECNEFAYYNYFFFLELVISLGVHELKMSIISREASDEGLNFINDSAV